MAVWASNVIWWGWTSLTMPQQLLHRLRVGPGQQRLDPGGIPQEQDRAPGHGAAARSIQLQHGEACLGWVEA